MPEIVDTNPYSLKEIVDLAWEAYSAEKIYLNTCNEAMAISTGLPEAIKVMSDYSRKVNTLKQQLDYSEKVLAQFHQDRERFGIQADEYIDSAAQLVSITSDANPSIEKIIKFMEEQTDEVQDEVAVVVGWIDYLKENLPTPDKNQLTKSQAERLAELLRNIVSKINIYIPRQENIINKERMALNEAETQTPAIKVASSILNKKSQLDEWNNGLGTKLKKKKDLAYKRYINTAGDILVIKNDNLPQDKQHNNDNVKALPGYLFSQLNNELSNYETFKQNFLSTVVEGNPNPLEKYYPNEFNQINNLSPEKNNILILTKEVVTFLDNEIKRLKPWWRINNHTKVHALEAVKKSITKNRIVDKNSLTKALSIKRLSFFDSKDAKPQSLEKFNTTFEGKFKS